MSAPVSYSQLNEKNKKELQQFITMETQKGLMQTAIHSLTDTCFKKCMVGTIRSGKLERHEETCLVDCTDRFIDLADLTVKNLGNFRSSS
ncbi:Tim10/DDP family zinc finger protein [Annulohypoxylon bovei var. microspora]|nr:Tim10/DDP family zinc finger protein [Annulohypoxylon bovei var. microspora]